MKVTMQQAFLAIRSLQKLVQLHEGKPVPLVSLTGKEMSLSYLEQVFSRLKKCGLVSAVRGPGGGYIPERENYSVGEVVRALNAGGLFDSPAVLAALDNVQLTEV